jgi:hypothetical protein
MKKIPRMGHRPPRLGRDILMGLASDPLRLYTVDYQLVAVCRRSGCDHRRELHTVLLQRVFGGEATLGTIGARFRCRRCGMRGARIEVHYLGPRREGR